MIQVSGCACSKRRPGGCVLRTQKVGCHTETNLVSWVPLPFPHGSPLTCTSLDQRELGPSKAI